MGGIFISYRRDDSADVTGRIFDRLIAHFDRSAVFMDVDNIPPGVDFRTHVQQAIGGSSVLLAIIGPDWCDNTDTAGKRRLDDPNDFVRIEIEAALERGIPVIPVLVRNAKMPSWTRLPGALQPLAYLNAPEVRSGHDFHSHMDRLIRKLQETYDLPLGPRLPFLGPVESAAPNKAPSPTDVAEPGRCPKCSRRNSPERVFCAGCSEPLREPCFECGADNSCWDLYCGGCAADLAVNRQQRMDQMASRRHEIESLREACRFDDVLPMLADVAGQSHPRFREFAAWARSTTPAVQAERTQQMELRSRRLEQANRLAQEDDFDGAIAEVEQVPEPLLYDDGLAQLAELRILSAAWQAQYRELEASRKRCAIEPTDEAGVAATLDELQSMAVLTSPRLQEFAAFARQRSALLTAELQRRVVNRVDQAKNRMSAHRYEEAAQQIEAIPAKRRTAEAAALLEEAQRQVRWVFDRREELCRRQAQAEECLARHAPAEAMPMLSELASLDHPRLLDLQQWAEPKLQAARAEIARLDEERRIREDAVRAARQLLLEADFAGAAEVLGKLPAAIHVPDTEQLLLDCRQKARELDRLTREIVRSIAAGDLPGVWEGARQFMALRPLPGGLIARISPCLELTRTNANQLATEGKWAEAANALHSIPVELRDRPCNRDLEHAAGVVQELQTLKARISTAQQQRDIPRLLADLDRYLQLKPNHTAGRQHLDKLLDECQRAADAHFEAKEYDQVIRVVERVPRHMQTYALRQLAERAKARSAALAEINAQFRAAKEQNDIAALVTAMTRLEEIQAAPESARARVAWFFLGPHDADQTNADRAIVDALVAIVSTMQLGDWITAKKKARDLLMERTWLANRPAFAQTCRFIDNQIVGMVWKVTPGQSRVSPTCVAFSPQGDRLAVGRGNTVAMHDVLDGHVRKTIQLPRGGLASVAFSPNGDSLAAGCADGTVLIVDGQGKIHALQGHQKGVKCVAFSPRAALLASCGDDHTVRVWDLKKLKEVRKVTPVGLLPKNKSISSMEGVVFSPGGQRILSCGRWDCQGVHVWDSDSGQNLKVGVPTTYSTANLIALRVSPNGRSLIWLDERGELQMWDFETRNHVPRLKKGVGSFDFSADGHFLIWRDSAKAKVPALHLLDLTSVREVWSLPVDQPLPKPPSATQPAADKPSVARPSTPKDRPLASPSESEFELSLDDPGAIGESDYTLAKSDSGISLTTPSDPEISLNLSADQSSEEDGDIFETNFEVPALNEEGDDYFTCMLKDESAAAKDDEDDFELSLDEAELVLGDDLSLGDLSAPEVDCRSLAVSPDGRHVALLLDGAVCMWALPYEFRAKKDPSG